MITLTPTQRTAALAQFKTAGWPERGDAIWTCTNGHEHQTRGPAVKCGSPKLVALSPELLANVEARA